MTTDLLSAELGTNANTQRWLLSMIARTMNMIVAAREYRLPRLISLSSRTAMTARIVFLGSVAARGGFRSSVNRGASFLPRKSSLANMQIRACSMGMGLGTTGANCAT